jgi:hypothetical protein
MTMRERLAVSLLKTTCNHFGDPYPKDPDHRLNYILVDAILDELMKPDEPVIDAALAAFENLSGDMCERNWIEAALCAAICKVKGP